MPSFARTKYIVYTILGLIVLGVVGFVIYSYVSVPTAPTTGTRQQPGVSGRPVGGLPGTPITTTPPPETNTPAIPSLPSIAEQRLARLTDFPVVSPALNKDDTRTLFYKKDGGDLFSVGFQGGTQDKVAHVTIVGLIEAVWSRARDRAAVFYLGDETLKGFLHIGTSSIAVMPQDIKSFSWSPDGKSLAYVVSRDGAANLIIADSSGKNPKTVFRTPIGDARISWVSSDKIAFQTAASGLSEGFIFAFARSSSAFSKVFGPTFGLQSLWSPDGSRILVSQTGRGGADITTGIYDMVKKQYAVLDVSTLPEKCVWSDAKEIICAVPRDIPAGTVLPDDWLRGEYNSSDRIVRIDAEKNRTEDMFNEGNFDMSDLTETKDKKNLLFVNRIDGTLWSLKLK